MFEIAGEEVEMKSWSQIPDATVYSSEVADTWLAQHFMERS